MKKISLSLLLLYCFFATDVVAQEFSSLTQFGESAFNGVTSMDIDKDGNSVLIGYFSGTIQFGTVSLVSRGQKDVFVAKLDKDHKVLWANHIGSSDDEDIPVDVVFDKNGNVYAVGSYANSITVYSAAANILLSHTKADVYFAKYNGNGVLLEAGNFKGASPLTAKGIDVDTEGKVYVVGETLLAPTITDIYIRRLGINDFSETIEGIYGADFKYVNDIEVDDYNNVHIAGAFTNDMRIDGSITVNLSASGTYDGFIIRYNSDLIYQSIQQLAGDGVGSISSVFNINIDGQDIYFAGTYEGFVSIGKATINSSDRTNFYAKVAYVETNKTFEYQYANSLESGEGGECTITKVKYNSKDELYACGRFTGTIEYGKGKDVKSSGFSEDAFVAKVDVNGQAIYAVAGGSPGLDDQARALAIYQDQVTTAGYFWLEAKFSNISVTSKGSTDIFVAQVSDKTTGLSILNTPNDVCMEELFEVRVTGNDLQDGNELSIYLSDEQGSFDNKVLMEKVATDTGAIFAIKVPGASIGGTEYRLQAESTQPIFSKISDPFIVRSIPQSLKVLGNSEVEASSTEAYSVQNEADVQFTWEIENGNQITGGTTNAITVQWGNDGQGIVRVFGTSNQGCPSVITELYVGVGDFISIEETHQLLTVYPSPVQNELVIEGMTAQNPVQYYVVYDLTGKVMLTQEFAGGTSATQLKVDVSHLQTGVYLIKMQMNDEVVVKEFQKL